MKHRGEKEEPAEKVKGQLEKERCLGVWWEKNVPPKNERIVFGVKGERSRETGIYGKECDESVQNQAQNIQLSRREWSST